MTSKNTIAPGSKIVFTSANSNWEKDEVGTLIRWIDDSKWAKVEIDGREDDYTAHTDDFTVFTPVVSSGFNWGQK